MDSPNIAFIGAGNMASSIIGGLIAKGFNAEHIFASDPAEKNLTALRALGPVQTFNTNADAVKNADIIVLAVKPQIMAQVVTQLAEHLQRRGPLIISIAAGITVNNLQTWLGKNSAIVRCMPNTPALIQAAATALFATTNVSATQKKLANTVLRAVGMVVWVDEEKDLDAVTAVSGSGPAYFFLLIEIMQEVAVEMGLDPNISRQLTLQTALGAAQMAVSSEESVADLRKKVTSPGGTTQKATDVMQENGFDEIIRRALLGARDRSIELAQA